MGKSFLVFGLAILTGLAIKVAFELYRYRKWNGIEDELDLWREIDRLGENPS